MLEDEKMDVTPIITTLITTIGTAIIAPVVAYLINKSNVQPKVTGPVIIGTGNEVISEPKRWKRAATIGLVILLVVNVALLVFFVAGYFSPVDLTVTYPSAGSNVGIAEVVRGTSQNIPNDKSIWVLVFIPQLDRYYPMQNPPLIQSNGDWSCLTTIGGSNDNGVFGIVAVLADKTAQDAFDSYNKNSAENSIYPGILTQDLPPGLTVYQRVNVTRTPIANATPAPTISVAINRPIEGSLANYSTTVSGTSQNIPNGQTIWLVVQVPKVNRYYPMIAPVAIDSTGNWYSFATLGGPSDIGDQFNVIAVVANKTAQDNFIEYNINSMNANNFPGTVALPAGAIEYSKVQVIRGSG
jgi:hypothetical protein